MKNSINVPLTSKSKFIFTWYINLEKWVIKSNKIILILKDSYDKKPAQTCYQHNLILARR